MAREFPLWVIVGLPWLAALVALLLPGLQVRVLGPRKATVFAHYFALGASALALMFTIQAIGHLQAPDDPRALAHTPLAEFVGPVLVGSVRIELTLIADRLSSCTALLITAAYTLARMFIAGPAGQRDLGIPNTGELDSVTATRALRRLGLLGLLEGGALLFVLAADLGLAALGWATLGIGAAIAVAREIDDERRASAATRVLVSGLAGDLALGAAAVVLVVSGIGLAHNEMWAPLTGDRLYAIGLFGVPTAELLALALLGAAILRMATMAWASNSLAEALLDAIVLPTTSVYLLLRYQRVLAYAPTVLVAALGFGMILALVAGVVALVRPARGLGRTSPRPGLELGLAGTGLAWTGLLIMAIGVGAWRTAVLLLLAQMFGRLGLRLALLVANAEQLPLWTARVTRVLSWAVAGVAPALGFVAIAQTLLDVLTRASVGAPWISWAAALVVLLVAFTHAAAIARIWYEQLGPKPGVELDLDEDGLDFAPLLLAFVGLTVLGLISLAAWFELATPILAWLELLLPLAGGHENAPLGLRPEFRDGLTVARSWVAGSGVLVALVTGFAWMWARERFRRAHGTELETLATTLELASSGPRRVLAWVALALAGLAELAARGLGRGLFEEGPRIGARLGRDAQTGLAPWSRRLVLGGARQALIGVILGLALMFGWLFGRPDVASPVPSDGYEFGGLRPKLIRAGGAKRSGASPGSTAEPSDATPTDAAPTDAGPTDATPTDATPTDAGPIDATPIDASPIDASPRAPRRDAAEPTPALGDPDHPSGSASDAAATPEVPR